jgi:hypothetical protein
VVTVFEYVASIYSIVLALSAASTLSALAETIKHRRSIKQYWVHTAWCSTFLFYHLALWRGIWFETAGSDQLTIFEMLPYFQWVVLWYIASRLLSPEADGARSIDLEEYFFSIKTPFLVFFLTPAIINFVWLFLLGGLKNAGTAVFITVIFQWLILLWGIFSRVRWVHAFVVVGYFFASLAQEILQGAIA